MGDSSDMADIERFMRSPEGHTHLAGIRDSLLGRTINDVTFTNEAHAIAAILHFDNGQTMTVFQPSLDLSALRDQHEDVIEREYFRDFPERRP